MTSIEADGWRLELLPHLGGAIGKLAFQGRDILRPAPADASDPLDTACFPLLPFANRVANGRFTFGGREIVLPTLPRFYPHALHGEAWLKPWQVTSIHDRSVTLQFRGGDAWPWPFTARQMIALGQQHATMEVSLANTGVTSMPAGLGLHPYFPASADTRLTFSAREVWLGEPGGIPHRIGVPADLFDFSDGPLLAEAPFIDHCYAGWRGAASIGDGDRSVAITTSSNATWAHVYAPRQQGFCCFEPVTHRPDAFNAPSNENSGVVVLRPGETLSMSMTLTVR